MSFFQPISISISQLGLGVFKMLSFIEKTMDCFTVTWESFFFFKKMLFTFYCACMWYLINFSILSRSVPISMFLYLSFIYYLNIWKNLFFFFNSTKSRLIKKGLVVETSLDVIYILPYYFSLVHVIYYSYLFKINLSIYFYSISQRYDKQEKKYFSVVIRVCCIMSCSEIFLYQDGVFRCSMGCTKKFFLVSDYSGDLM